jgi:hypothetical protein
MYDLPSLPLQELIVSRSSKLACLQTLANFKAETFYSELVESSKGTDIVLDSSEPADYRGSLLN